MTKPNVNANAVAIINAVAGGLKTSKAVAESMNVNVAVVTGNLASLKKNDLITVKDGNLSITKAAKSYVVGKAKAKVTTAGNKTSKKVGAAKIYSEETDRKVILARFVNELGMSKAGANTYFYSLKK
jgi:hypothetical protein